MRCCDKVRPGYRKVNAPLFPLADNLHYCFDSRVWVPASHAVTTLRMTAFLLLFSLDTSAILFYKRHSESWPQCQVDGHTLYSYLEIEIVEKQSPGQMSLSTWQFKNSTCCKRAHTHTHTFRIMAVASELAFLKKKKKHRKKEEKNWPPSHISFATSLFLVWL